MSDKKPRTIAPYSGGVFQGLANRIKLILRLIGDPRVSILLKLIPVTSLVYLVFPDIAPGPIDDAAIIWLSTYLFVELCPPNVVQEHLDAIEKIVQATSRTLDGTETEQEIKEEDILEGEIIEEEHSKQG
jgi:hypothetical protein